MPGLVPTLGGPAWLCPVGRSWGLQGSPVGLWAALLGTLPVGPLACLREWLLPKSPSNGKKENSSQQKSLP